MEILWKFVSSDKDSKFLTVTLIRVSLGGFFFASGYHKAFTDTGFNTMLETLITAGIPIPIQMAIFVSTCEVICGFMLAVGLLTRLSALILMIISTVALATVGVDAIPPDLSPLAWYSWLMYLPETLYILMLLLLAVLGGGPLAADRYLSNFIAANQTHR